ncbi:MAG: hypothetical protein WCO13_14745 [Bacteroidota bacterium]
MKKSLKILFLAVVTITFISCGTSSKLKEAGWMASNYEVECMGTGMDGTQLIKVWGYGKKPDDAISHAKKNGVHAIIFKGITVGKKGCMTIPLSLEPGAEEKYREYYEKFFMNGGKYLQFISISGEGANESVKVGSMYKCAIIVSINHSNLRKELEAAGVIKNVSDGFAK